LGERKKALTLLLILVSSAISITEIKAVEADSRILIVPDDYPTIASALGNATDGDTIFMKRGTYDGPRNQTLVINKTISIIGEDPKNTMLNLHPNYTEWSICTQIFRSDPDAIRIEANDVRLLNLKLDFIGEIRVTSDRVQIMDNTIRSHSTVRGIIVNGSNCNITNNYIFGQITLKGSSHTIYQNNFSVLRLESTKSSMIKSNIFRFFYLNFSHNNIISRNSVNTVNLAYAIYMSNSNYNIFHDNKVTVTKWNIDLILTQSQNNTFYNNAFIDEDNDPHVKLGATSTNNFWDNSTIGNYWSNYNGTDENADGIGDSPYIINENNHDNYPLMDLDTFFGYDFPNTISNALYMISPQNRTYSTSNISLIFTIIEEISWMGYSLDGQDNVTITENILNFTELSTGSHILTVYANDTSGNTAASETISFTIAKESEPEQPEQPEQPDQLNLILGGALIVIAIATGLGLLIYFKKRK
jgi:hypothetical protein